MSLSIEPQRCDLLDITCTSFSFTAKVEELLFSTETTLSGYS